MLKKLHCRKSKMLHLFLPNVISKSHLGNYFWRLLYNENFSISYFLPFTPYYYYPVATIYLVLVVDISESEFQIMRENLIKELLTYSKRFHKYFWDGMENWGSDYELCRIIEYASFPDLIHYPYNEVQANIDKLPLSKLRTSEERKEFITRLAPLFLSPIPWEDAIWKMIDHYRDKK